MDGSLVDGYSDPLVADVIQMSHVRPRVVFSLYESTLWYTDASHALPQAIFGRAHAHEGFIAFYGGLT